MNNQKEMAMFEEARADIIECLENGFDGYYSELHNEVFNTDYYIIGAYEAKQALQEYDVFDAIYRVQDYEDKNFGERYTDISDPEKLVNMLYYIIGEEFISCNFDIFQSIWNMLADKETNKEIIEFLKIKDEEK